MAELQAEAPLLQRFRIDVYLKRNLKALHSIAQYDLSFYSSSKLISFLIPRAGDAHFETLVGHVKQHKLHAEAVAIFAELALRTSAEDSKLQRLLLLFGDHLADAMRSDEAGYAYDAVL